MSSQTRKNLKRKAAELQSPQTTGIKTVWEVKMVDGKDIICVYAKTCKEATSQCITALFDRIGDNRDRGDLLSSSFDMLKSPEQDENTWRQFAIKNKVSTDHVKRFIDAVDTCAIRRCAREDPQGIRWVFPPGEEELLPELNLDWSHHETELVNPDWECAKEFARETPADDVELVNPDWDCAKEFAKELYGPLSGDFNGTCSTAVVV